MNLPGREVGEAHRNREQQVHVRQTQKVIQEAGGGLGVKQNLGASVLRKQVSPGGNRPQSYQDLRRWAEYACQKWMPQPCWATSSPRNFPDLYFYHQFL